MEDGFKTDVLFHPNKEIVLSDKGNISPTSTQMQPKSRNNMMAVEVQRRLELKEFYLQRGNQVSANLVDEMFRISNFNEIKAQVNESFGTLPKNWKNESRYDKYKKLVKLGVRPEKVREEMEEDGIDPDEFLTPGVPKNGNSIIERTRGASKIIRKKSRVYISGAIKRTRSRVGSKSEIKSYRTGKVENSSKEIVRTPFVRRKKTNKLEVAPRKEKDYLSDSDTDTDCNASSKSSVSLYGQDEEDFAYSKEDIKVKQVTSKRIFGKLTEKNQLGQIHNAKHYFKGKAGNLLRKTSVANIKRNACVKQSMFEDKHLTLTRAEMENNNSAFPQQPPPVASKRLTRRPKPALPKRTRPLNNKPLPDVPKRKLPVVIPRKQIYQPTSIKSKFEMLEPMADIDVRKGKRKKEKMKTIDTAPPPPSEEDLLPESFMSLTLPPPPPPPYEDETVSEELENIDEMKVLAPPLPPGAKEAGKVTGRLKNDPFESEYSFQGLANTPVMNNINKTKAILRIPSDTARRKSGSRPSHT